MNKRGVRIAKSPLPRIIGIFLFAAGAVFMLGWTSRALELLGGLSGFSMVFNTAACLALAACALIIDDWHTGRRLPAQIAIGVTIAIWCSATLGEYVMGSDFGIDWPTLQRWLPDVNPHPGRMAVMTCIGFVLTGLVLAIKSFAISPVRIWILRSLIMCIALIGIIGVVSYVLDLRLLFDVYMFPKIPAAIGFVLLSVGLWHSSAFETGGRISLVTNEISRITLTSAEIMVMIAAICGIASFAIMQHRAEQLLGNDLAHLLDQRTSSLIRAIALREAAANRITTSVATRDWPGFEAGRGKLQRAATHALTSGFLSVIINNRDGRKLAAAGEQITASDPVLPMTAPYPMALMWDGRFVLEARIPIIRQGHLLGTVNTQQLMPEFNELLLDIPELGETGEIMLCSAETTAIVACMPTRLRPWPLHLPRINIERKPSPASLGLQGKSGVSLKYIDSRKKETVAAYEPVSGFGLAMVLKQDTASLYAPLQKPFLYLLLLIAILLAIGILMLRSRVKPLAQRLVEREEQLRMAIEGSQLVMWDWDVPRGKVYLNEQWQLLLGGPSQPTVTTIDELGTLVHPDDASTVRKHLRQVVVGHVEHYDIEHRVRTHGGQWKWIRSRGKIVSRARNRRVTRAIGTNADIDAKKNAELLVMHQASHDALTGLANRAMFHDRLEQAMARSKRYHRLMALLYLDIDRFKSINDTLGHAVGDGLLKAFTERLVNCVRQTDTVARLGGDEFTVILEELGSRDNGRAIAEKIVAAMRPEFSIEHHDLNITTSVGLAFFEGDPALTGKELLKKADQALYEVKGAGRNGYREAA